MRLDTNNEYHQLVISACAILITEEGYLYEDSCNLFQRVCKDLFTILGEIKIE